MSSDVDIANLSLAHLGDDATVTELTPPEGSVQAEHCERFYPMARDALLEMHPWNFNTRRKAPSSVASQTDAWQYAYLLPTNTLKVWAVLPPGAPDDYSAPVFANDIWCGSQPAGLYQPQPFVVETLTNGTMVVYTNQEEADIRFSARITDTTKFSPLFTLALSRLLASYLAGPVIKGDVGRAEAKGQYQLFLIEFAKAVASDSGQRSIKPIHTVPWIANR